MKKEFLLLLSIISFTLSSCGSTAPCGLAKKTDTSKKENLQKEILIADANE